ncbi:uncharacterized protein rab44 isoform X3 [Trematomus bernacchii]|uniref:uncharacterized protein rab44 isoform X3 n=1 Tax=Trematomus bernacchii TaxID=40690 RepID=UPI00146DF045|nr:uncharacterized protein rab44 isoform X3 [Trematomus bernacchii]
MSAQSAKKKRLGSRRRGTNQNEKTKADEFQITDSTSEDQRHLTVDNTESLKVLAEPDNSLYETNPPAFSGNRRKLGSSRKNKGHHVREYATESCHETKEEVKETIATKQMSLTMQHVTQEVLIQESENMSATHESCLYSASEHDYFPELQNATITNYPEADLDSVIPKSENLQAHLYENVTNSKIVSDSFTFVQTMEERVNTSETLYCEEDKESAHCVSNSELTRLSLASRPSVDHANVREMSEQKLPDVCTEREKECKEIDETELLRKDGNLQGNYLVSESVVLPFATTPEITTEETIRRENTENESNDEPATMSSPKEEMLTDEEQNEPFSLSERKCAYIIEDASSKQHEQDFKPAKMHKIDHSPHSENLIHQTEVRDTYQSELNVKRSGYSPINQEMSNPEVKGSHQSEDGVNKLHEQERRPTEIEDMPQQDNTSVSVIHAATEKSEIISCNPMDPNEIRDTNQCENVVKITCDSPTYQDISIPDNKQDEYLNEESIFEDLEQTNEDHHVSDTKEPPISDIEGVDSALGQVKEIEGQVQYDMKPSAEPKGHEEGLFSVMEEGESCSQAVQSGITVTSDSQPQQNIDFNPIGNRRKLGSSRRNKGRQHVKDSVNELYHEPTGEDSGNARENKSLETELSLQIEPVVQEQTKETMLKGMEIFDTAPTDVGELVKDNSLVGISELTGSNVHARLTEDQKTNVQSNVGEMPEEEFPNVCTVTEKESMENDNVTEMFRHGENVQTNYLMSESQVTTETNESSITSEITTEEQDLRENTEPECSVEQEAFASSKEESTTIEETHELFNVSEVKGAHQSDDGDNKLHEQEVKPTEIQEISQIDFSSDHAIHVVSDKSEIISGNTMDQTESRETNQCEIVVKIPDDSHTSQKMSLLRNKQDEYLNEESIFEDLEQKNEDHHVSDTKEPPISDIEGVDSALGQVKEIEGQVQYDMKPSAEPKGHEEGLFSVMEEGESCSQAVQSGITVTSDSQPQQNIDFNPIGNRRKLGSSRRNKGRQHVKDSVAELYHEPTGEDSGNTRENKSLETELSLQIEPVVQEQTKETMLKGMEIFDTAPTDVGELVKDNSLVGISELTGSNVHARLTEDQKTNVQSNVGEMPEEEFPNVCTVTEKESMENDNVTEMFRHGENVQTNYLMSESQVTTETNESSITSEITTEEQDLRENSEPECSVEQEAFASSKEESTTIEETHELFNVSEVDGDNKLHEQEVNATEIQEIPQIDFSSDHAIHAATENSQIISGNTMDQTEIRETNQCEMVVKIPDDSHTSQKMSVLDNKQDEYLNEESIFEDLEQTNEDHHVSDTKEPPISDIEGVDSALGQVKEIEGQVQYDMKPSAEPKGREEGLFSEMEEGESCSQAVQSGITVTSDSHPQQNIDFNPIGNRRKLGSSRRNKGRQHVKDSVAELYHEPTGEDSGNTRENKSLETELSLQIEPVVQEQTKETMLKGMEIFDTAPTDVGELVKDNSLVGISELTGSNVHARLTEVQKTTVQSNVGEMPEEEFPNVCTVTEKESMENDNVTELFRHAENVQTNYLVSESQVRTANNESSITSEITTEEQDLRENSEPEQEAFASSKEESTTIEETHELFNVSEVDGDNKLHEQEVNATEIQEIPQIDFSSDHAIHAATENSQIISGNTMDQTEIRETNQCEMVVKIPDDSPTSQKMSVLDNKQDEYLNEESIFEDLEQTNEDHHVSDTKEPPISDIEGVDSALGQVKEIEGQVQYDMKPSAEPKGREEGLFSEMEEGESCSQAVQSGITVTSDSQPQQNIDFNPIGNRRKLGSSRRNKGRQHVKDSVAELYHEPTGEDSGNTRGNKSLETELSLQIEPVVQEQTKETMLKGMEIFDTAPTDVGELVKENSLVGISELTGSNVHARLTEDQKTNVQSNVGEMPEEEFPNVCTVTEKESMENDNVTEMFRHGENVQTNYLMSESQVTTANNESSITSEITTEEQDLRENTEPECSVEQEAFASSKEESTTIEETHELFNVSEVDGDNKLHEQEVNATEIQEIPQIDFSSDHAIHAATENSQIISGNTMDQTEIRETNQCEMVVKIPDDSPTSQKMSVLDNKQDEYLNEESIFEDLEQTNEDHHVSDTKEPPISDIEGVDSALGQVKEIEGQVQYDMKPSAEPKGHEEGLFSEMEEGESCSQAVQSGITVTSDSQPQQNIDFNPIGNRRKLGSSRRNKGRQHVKDSVAELYHEPTGEDSGNTRENKSLETELSLQIEPVVQEQTKETMLKGMEIFDTAPTDVGELVKENSLVGISELTGSNVHARLTEDQKTNVQSNVGEMPEEEFPNVCTVTEKESMENDNVTELFRHGENVQTNYLMSESQITTENNESSITSEITTEEQDLRENSEPECSVEQEAFASSKEESTTIEETHELFNVSEVDGDNKLHEQEVNATEIQEIPKIDFSSDHAIHAATENSQIISGNTMDQTEIRETNQCEIVVKIPDDSHTSQKMSLLRNKQDEYLNEESIFEDLEQKNEDHHVSDTKEPPISDIEGVDSALGQVKEIEGQVQYDMKPSAEPKGHEEGLFSEMEEGESCSQAVQSGITVTSDSQPQQNIDFNPIGNRRKLGSSRRNKGRQHVKDSVAELYHEPTGEDSGNTRENKSLETELSLPIEPVVQEQTKETMLKGMEIFDTAPTDVGELVKDNSLVGISELTGSNVHARLTEDQKTNVQSNVGEMPEEEFPNVCTVTEKESMENDNVTELFRHGENVQTNYLMSESQVTTETNESSITSEITTEEQDLRENTEPECSVEQEAFASSKEESTTIEETHELFNVSEVKGAHQSDDGDNKLHEQEVKPTEIQEIPQIDFSSDHAIHVVSDKSEIISGNTMDQTEIRETNQCEIVVKIPDDSHTSQKMSLLRNKQDEYLNEESIFEDLEQTNEDHHVSDTKEPPISDIEGVDSALGQVKEIEGQVQYDMKPSAEPKGHGEGLFSEMEEGESCSQAVQSGITVTSDSQPQQNIDFNPIGNRRKLGSSRRNKGRQHVKDSVAELYHEPTGEDSGYTRGNKSLETELSLQIEPVVQEQTKETMLKGMEIFDTAPTDVGELVKDNSLVGISELTGSNVHARLTEDQKTNVQSNVGEMPEEEFPNVCTVTEKESMENDNVTEMFRHGENVQTNYLMSESQVTTETNESSITSEITTEEQDLRENSEPEQEAFASSKEESTTIEETHELFNVSEVKGAHQSDDGDNKLHEQEVKPTEIQEIPQIDFSSDHAIHVVSDKSEIISGNTMDQTESRETNQCEIVVKIPDDSHTSQKMSLLRNKQDEYLNEESIFEDLEQTNEDHHVYDTKEPPISDIEGVDSALGQVKEIEGQVQYDMKSSAEPKGREEGLFSEMEEGESCSQAVQSGITVTSDSQPQQNIDFNPIGNRRKLGSSRRNKGRQHVKDSVAELYHEPTGEDSANTRGNKSLETELSLQIEPVVQEQTKETMLKGMEIFDTAPTDVGELVKDNSLVGISELTGSNVHARLTEDQKTNVQSNVGEMPEEEFPNVCTVTEKESMENDNVTEMFRHGENVQTNYLISESQVTTANNESSITSEITTEEQDLRENSEPECTTNPTGNRRKFGSSRRNKGPLHIKDTTRMSLVTETIKQEELKKKSDLDLSSNVSDEENTDIFLQEGIILSQNEKDNSAFMKTDIDLSPSNDVFVNSNKDVDEEQNKQKKETENVCQLGGCDTVKTDLTQPPEVSVWKADSDIQTISYHGDNVSSRPIAFDVLEQEETFQFQSSEALSCDKDINVQQTNDTSPTVRDVTVKYFKSGPESSMYMQVSNQDADGEQSEDPLKSEHKAQEINISEKITKNKTLAPFHTGLEENFRAEPAVNMFEESEISSHLKEQEESHSDNSENVQGRSKQKRRKMGSTRRAQLNRKPEEKSDERESDFKTEADMRHLEKIEGLEELPMIMTAKVSQSEHAKASQSPMNKEQEANETSTVHNNRQNIPSSDLQVVNPAIFVHVADERESERNLNVCVEPPQIDDFTTTERQIPSPLLSENTEENRNTVIIGESFVSLCEITQSMQNDEESVSIIEDQTMKSADAPVVADLEILTYVVREGAEHEHISAQFSKQQLDNPTEEVANKIIEMKNPSPNRRKKMGSTRRNFGSRHKREDLHQEQDVDNEATETASNVGDVKTELFSNITEDELQLNLKHKDTGSEQRKENLFETVEYSQIGDSHIKPHQPLEDNPVPPGQLIETEHQRTPNSFAAIPSTSPKEDLMSETASGGRRRKMGSSRKSHGLKRYENQTASGDKIQDTQHERDVRSNTDESAIKTPEELREESLSLVQISEAGKSEKKPSNISISKEEIAPRTVSEKTVQHLYAEVELSQQKFSLEGHSRIADHKANAYNVMMVGDSSVGKTSFMKRAQSGKFSLDLPASVGIDSCMWTVVVEGKPVVLQLWDTAGQERFHSITRQIFHKAHAFLLMYDITSSETFSAVSYWANCIQEGADEDVNILLVGNKSDRAERQVKIQEAENLAKEYNFEFMECSAATGENVVQGLETVARMLSEKHGTREEAMVLHKEPPQKKSSGCC